MPCLVYDQDMYQNVDRVYIYDTRWTGCTLSVQPSAKIAWGFHHHARNTRPARGFQNPTWCGVRLLQHSGRNPVLNTGYAQRFHIGLEKPAPQGGFSEPYHFTAGGQPAARMNVEVSPPRATRTHGVQIYLNGGLLPSACVASVTQKRRDKACLVRYMIKTCIKMWIGYIYIYDTRRTGCTLSLQRRQPRLSRVRCLLRPPNISTLVANSSPATGDYYSQYSNSLNKKRYSQYTLRVPLVPILVASIPTSYSDTTWKVI